MGACASVSKGMKNEDSSPRRATTPARALKPEPTEKVDQQTTEGEGVAVNVDGDSIGPLLDNVENKEEKEEAKEEKEAIVEAQKKQEEARVSTENEIEEEAKEEEPELVNKIEHKEEALADVEHSH